MDNRQAATLALTQKRKKKKNLLRIYIKRVTFIVYFNLLIPRINFQGDSRGILSLEAGRPALNYTVSAGK